MSYQKQNPEMEKSKQYQAAEAASMESDRVKLDQLLDEDDLPDFGPIRISAAEKKRIQKLDLELREKIRPIIEEMLTKGIAI